MQRLNKIVTKRNILISIIIISIVLLIPILWVSFYNVASADDFNYGRYTINVLSSGGILKLLEGVFKTVKHFYNNWQGTYSAIALFSLNPAIFGEDFYFITTFFILGFYFFSLTYLFKQLVRKFLKTDKYTYWIVLLLFFMLCIETLVDKTQGLYWWNGSSYYIVFFSLELLEISLLIKQYFLNEKTKKNTIILFILISIISGGNFIVAFEQILLLVFLNIYLIIKKKDKSALPYLGLSIACFAISALAPGNKIRQGKVIGMNPIKAILLSFATSFNFIFEWMTPIKTIILSLIIIALYPTYQKINKKFSYPVIVILFMYCILSSEFTPTLYSTSDIGPARLLNIIYFSYLFFIIISVYYLIGYIRNILKERKILSKNSYAELIKYIKEHSFILLGIIVIVLLGVSYLERHNLTSYETTALLMRNEVKTYKKEWKERYKILKDDSIKQVEFKELTYHPYPIFFTDISKEKDSWLNYPMADIYNKEYVIVVGEENEKN